MKQLQSLSALVLVLGFGWMALGDIQPAVDPSRLPTADDFGTAEQFRAALQGPTAASDAAYLAAVFDAAAERLEQDGRQDEPLISRRIQVESLVHRLGQAAVMGKTQGRYPALPEIVGKTFATQFPSEQGELTAADRGLAAGLLRGLAAGCRKGVGR